MDPSTAGGVAAELASTLQSASIQRHPDPSLDINPSTAASQKAPVQIGTLRGSDVDEVAEDEVPISVLRPTPRRQNLPPLPDLRFEQSYLKSIEKAEGWVGVAWITVRDQVCWICLFCVSF
jgi:Autophagy receptor ATG43